MPSVVSSAAIAREDKPRSFMSASSFVRHEDRAAYEAEGWVFASDLGRSTVATAS